MVNPWYLLAVFLATAMAFAASVTYGLAVDGGPGPQGTAAALGPASLPDRTDCKEIYGRAYRSDTERQWFNDNCSTWSQNVGIVPDPGGGSAATPPVATQPQPQPSTPPPQGRDCNQIRGTPYQSDTERSWYLANCGGGNVQAGAAASTGPDRTDCNQIRGTPYRSDTERNWFLANCQPVGGQPQTPAPRVTPAVTPPQQPGPPAPRGRGRGRGR